MQALRWLAGVSRAPRIDALPLPALSRSFRAYAPKELAKLDAQCRGFLLTLESSGILTPSTRELVIDRALAASGEALTLEQLKIVVLMVMWNLQADASRLLAEDLFDGSSGRLPS